MTREETKKIIQIIVATYPNFKPSDLKSTVDAWYFFLEEFKYQDIAVALKTFVNTSGSGFAPSAAELIALITKPAEMMELTEQEAWAMVRKAVSNSFYGAEQEFEKFPEAVQKAVGSPQMLRNWGQSTFEALDSVIASNFQRSYRTIVNRKEFVGKLPVEARLKLEQTTLAIEGKE